jgi:hypothetical protein
MPGWKLASAYRFVSSKIAIGGIGSSKLMGLKLEKSKSSTNKIAALC